MKKIVVVFLILFFASQHLWAQETTPGIIHGKVTAESSDLEGVYVINLRTVKGVTTSSGGYFSIPAKECDTLMFSSIQFKAKRIALTKSNSGKELVFVHLETMVNQLNEVRIVRYKNINAVSMGIIPMGQKSYTSAERKLKTAGDFKPIHLLGLLGGSLEVDPIINAFSGRTAMLKKELEVEKKELVLMVLNDMFDKNYFVKKLKISEDYVKGFQYYIAENNRFVETLKSNNVTMATFLIGELAVKYNKINDCDQE